MQKQYTLINECLKVLRQCYIPAMPKLRLEVQLFQIKLLLLRDDVKRDIRRKFCSEAALQRILQQLAGLNHTEGRDVAIEAVGQDLRQIGFDLAEAIAKVPARKGLS